MFTGVIQQIGLLKEISSARNCKRFNIYAPKLNNRLKPGDSISVDGICFTVTNKVNGRFFVEVMGETLKKSISVLYKKGQKVNLELPLKLGDKIDGHFVTGHVDCKSKISNVLKFGKNYILTIKYPPRLKKYLSLKGSIAINGVSLTIARLEKDKFAVNLIPYTLKNTNLYLLKKNNYVNIEVDILARYAKA